MHEFYYVFLVLREFVLGSDTSLVTAHKRRGDKQLANTGTQKGRNKNNTQSDNQKQMQKAQDHKQANYKKANQEQKNKNNKAHFVKVHTVYIYLKHLPPGKINI